MNNNCEKCKESAVLPYSDSAEVLTNLEAWLSVHVRAYCESITDNPALSMEQLSEYYNNLQCFRRTLNKIKELKRAKA